MALSDLQQTIDQLNQLMANAYSAAMVAAGLPPANLGAGGGLMPIFRAHAMLAIVLQAQIEYLAAYARLSTIPENADGTPNPDLDSYCSAFNVNRIQPTTAFTTTAQASLPSPSNVAQTLPVGAVLSRPDGTQYVVVADATQPAYGLDASGNGIYTLPAGQTSMFFTLQCLTAGTIGNTSANTITTLVSGPGIPAPSATFVFTNTAAIVNGNAIETDTAYKERFILQWSEGKVATQNAIASAIVSVGTNLAYSLSDTIDNTGNPTSAMITAIVGYANNAGVVVPDSTLAAIKAAISAVYSFGIRYQVFSAQPLPIDVTGEVIFQSGIESTAAGLAAVNASIAAYTSSIGLDPNGGSTTASLARVYAAILSTPGVSDATNVTLNGQQLDVTIPFGQQATTGSITLEAVTS